MFSQNNEEKLILEYFGDTKGTFLDIGAYDGVHLSNTHALALKGWKGFCFEPSPEIYKRLQSNYQDHPDVLCFQEAIANHNGTMEFYDNPNAVATGVLKETERWKDEKFNKIEVPCITFQTFFNNWKPIRFEFISIDAEGMDLDILRQIDFNETHTMMVCVEWNGKNYTEFDQWLTGFGFMLKMVNAENLIYAKVAKDTAPVIDE